MVSSDWGSLPLDDPAIMRRINFHLRLRRVMDYIEHHPDLTIDLQNAATVACMERTAFSKFFHRSVGLRFHEFLLAWRVQRAARLMLESDSSLSEIAYGVGFQSLVTFERAFKKFAGCVPSQYRDRLLRKNRVYNKP
jgi:AraC-like DNA-binding protein